MLGTRGTGAEGMKRFNQTILFAVIATVLLVSWVIYRSSGDRDDGPARQDESTANLEAVESTAEPEPAVTDPVAEHHSTRPTATLPPAESDRRTVSASAATDGTRPRDGRSSDRLDDEAARAELADLRDRVRAADALPGERRVLTNSRLDSAEAMELLDSDTFSEAVDEMAWDASRDLDAQALTEIYRDYAARILEAGGEFLLDRLVCGLRVCVGQALALSDEARWELHGLYAAGSDGPPMYASAYHAFVTPDGRTFYRFMFTIDPESRGIVVGTP